VSKVQKSREDLSLLVTMTGHTGAINFQGNGGWGPSGFYRCPWRNQRGDKSLLAPHYEGTISWKGPRSSSLQAARQTNRTGSQKEKGVVVSIDVRRGGGKSSACYHQAMNKIQLPSGQREIRVYDHRQKTKELLGWRFETLSSRNAPTRNRKF